MITYWKIAPSTPSKPKPPILTPPPFPPSDPAVLAQHETQPVLSGKVNYHALCRSMMPPNKKKKRRKRCLNQKGAAAHQCASLSNLADFFLAGGRQRFSVPLRCFCFAFFFFGCFFSICVLTWWAAVFTSAFATPLHYEGIGINIAGEPGCLKPPRLRCLPVG